MVCIPPSLSLFVSKYNKHSIIRKGTAPKAMQEKGCIHRLAPRFAQSPLGCPEGAVHSLQVITRVLGKLHRGGGFSKSASEALPGLCWQGGLTRQPWQGGCALCWAVHQYGACRERERGKKERKNHLLQDL